MAKEKHYVDGVCDNNLTLDNKVLGDMRDGNVIEYDTSLFREGRTDLTPFEHIMVRANIAKALVAVDGINNMINQAAPEIKLIKKIDDLILKCGGDKAEQDDDLDDMQKTNLPYSPMKTEDSVASLPEENRKKLAKESKK